MLSLSEMEREEAMREMRERFLTTGVFSVLFFVLLFVLLFMDRDLVLEGRGGSSQSPAVAELKLLIDGNMATNMV